MNFSEVLPKYVPCVSALAMEGIPPRELEIMISYFSLSGKPPKNMIEVSYEYSIELDEVDRIIHEWHPFLIKAYKNGKKSTNAL